jgi:hypothetical protein
VPAGRPHGGIGVDIEEVVGRTAEESEVDESLLEDPYVG